MSFITASNDSIQRLGYTLQRVNIFSYRITITVSQRNIKYDLYTFFQQLPAVRRKKWNLAEEINYNVLN